MTSNKPRWNERQQEVLDSLKDSVSDPKNILVSAAAGSGKTAVLVERIIQTIVMGLASIDEILVVTFTNDAAAQMRSKILSALEKLAASSLDDEALSSRLLRQLSLAENADIMTIDSFCNKIVRENFNIVGIDPSFEIYDPNEIALLKDEVLDEVLGRHYQDDKVMAGLTSFFFKKNIDDSIVKDIILSIHNVSESFADKNAWYEAARENTTEEGREILGEKWVKDYIELLNQTAGEALEILTGLISKAGSCGDEEKEDGYAKLFDIYISDRDKVEAIKCAATLAEKAEAAKSGWSVLRRSKAFDAFSEEEFEDVKEKRKQIKGFFSGIVTEDEIVEEALAQSAVKNCLIDIVIDFDQTLMKEKKKLKKYEFSDIAHAAFNILYDVKEKKATKVGLAKAQDYKYIYIDEYQDSSDLQEELLNAVARRDFLGRPNNIFMVGDVKQSIYRFRMARPEIFLEKSGDYQSGDSGRLINLNMNYRSRKAVLAGTNSVFRYVMTPNFGGILYDFTVKLNPPADEDYKNHYPDTDLAVGGNVSLEKIYGYGTYDSSDEEDEESLEYTKEEVEAIEIGHLILDAVESTYVLNENFSSDIPESSDNARYRKARFSDIVILQRNIRGHMGMVRIYEQMGIPVAIDDAGAYFEELEISTLISVLRIVDNVQQDIPYASVLLSHIGGLTDEELVWVVGKSPKSLNSLADKVAYFIETYSGSEDDTLRSVADKLSIVKGLRDRWAKLSPFLSTHDLLETILKDTDYESFVMAMPDGKRRIENIKKLIYHAGKFESVRNAALLDFLKYIDKCMNMDKNLDSASGSSSDSDGKGVVHITSIHKSKGLEYPIVIVALMDKAFRLSEKKGDVAVYPDYHLVINRLKSVGRRVKVKKPSIKESIVKLLIEKEIREEEARLLYVAMTRAKEKLYLIGYSDSDSPLVVGQSRSYMDYVNYSLKRQEMGEDSDIEGDTLENAYPIETYDRDVADIIGDFKKIYRKKNRDYTNSLNSLMNEVRACAQDMKEEEPELIEDNPYNFEYRYRYFTAKKAKLSVSEIKHAEMKESTEIQVASDVIETAVVDDIEANEESKESALEKEAARARAARRGTVIHAIFERLSYDRVASEESLGYEIERVLSDPFFSDEDRKLVSIKTLLSFYSEDESSIFQRMRKAYQDNNLRREQQFIAGLRLEELPGSAEEMKDLGVEAISEDSDFVVIQGIIDAFFYEGSDIILVDYKTDNVKTGQELLDRYAAQMYLYALTLEKLTGKTVADCILYSTRIGEVHYPEWRNYICCK